MAKRYVVTGGGGFLGQALVRALLRAGNSVVSLGRGDYPRLRKLGAQIVRADLGKAPPVLCELGRRGKEPDWYRFFEGVDAVFHVAAKVDMWGHYDDFFRVNVLGTRHVLEACLAHGVRKLIYTSSPSVVADGKNLKGVNEQYPIPQQHAAHYPATKAIAEQEILAANDQGIYTISLRPHLIFGPGDNHFVPTILERSRQGRLVQVGSGHNLTDLTYITDCVRAHLCAAKALEENPSCRGKPYFISQGEPVRMWDWINEVLRLSHLAPIKRSVPKWMAYLLAFLFESGARYVPGYHEPLFTRFLVSQMTTDHYFDISAAERDLGFRPSYSIQNAMQETFGAQQSSPVIPNNEVAAALS